MIINYELKGSINEPLYNKMVSDLSSIEDLQELHVSIDSYGGEVQAGFNIYNFLKDLRKKGVKVITYAGSMVGSIADAIFLAGEERIAYNTTTAWIHEPTIDGLTADYFQATADDLNSTKNKLFLIHRAVANSDVTDEEIMQSLSKETHLDAKDYLSKGYATKIIDNTAFAEKQDKLTNNKKTMNEEKTNLLMEKMDKVVAFLSDLLPQRKTMNIVLQSIDGVQLEFPDLTDGQTPKIGDSVLIAGNPANGEFKMADGTIYECIDGKIFEIYSADMQIDSLRKENESLKSSVESLKSEKEMLKNVIENSKKDILELRDEMSIIVNERRTNKGKETKTEQNTTKFNFKKRNF